MRTEGEKPGRQLCIGDLVVVELAHEGEAYMVSAVTKAWHKHEGADVEVLYMGTVKRDDQLVCMHKLERCSGGRGESIRVYELCDGDAKEIPVFTDDGRLVLNRRDFPEHGQIMSSSSAQISTNLNGGVVAGPVHGFKYKMKYELEKEALSKIFALTCDAGEQGLVVNLAKTMEQC